MPKTVFVQKNAQYASAVNQCAESNSLSLTHTFVTESIGIT